MNCKYTIWCYINEILVNVGTCTSEKNHVIYGIPKEYMGIIKKKVTENVYEIQPNYQLILKMEKLGFENIIFTKYFDDERSLEIGHKIYSELYFKNNNDANFSSY